MAMSDEHRSQITSAAAVPSVLRRRRVVRAWLVLADRSCAPAPDEADTDGTDSRKDPP